MKTSVVIGRFQIDKLTDGHLHVINEARKWADKLVIVIGDSPLNYTSRNPLPFSARKSMLAEAYMEADIHRIEDNPSDEIWSQNMDTLLSGYENITLYGGRDSFISHYHGKYPTVKVGEIVHVSASEQRKDIAHSFTNTRDFRRGLIHGIGNRFPTAYPTVDIALVKWKAGGTDDHHLMLGRKKGKMTYVFPGGFVDPTDVDMEHAANRELNEEISGLNTHGLPRYIGSTKINDFRYRGTSDGIITSFFISYFMSGNPVASDDLEEARWFSLTNFNLEVLSEHHHVLYHKLIDYINSLQ